LSRQLRHRLAALLAVCWIGDAVALGLTTPTSALASLGFVVSLWLFVVGIVFCVYIRDEPGDSRGEGGDPPGGGGGSGGGGGPPRRPDPLGGPDWWPKFERDFRTYVEQERRVPLRTP
jgi:uncharacterized membrane protein YgcG